MSNIIIIEAKRTIEITKAFAQKSAKRYVSVTIDWARLRLYATHLSIDDKGKYAAKKVEHVIARPIVNPADLPSLRNELLDQDIIPVYDETFDKMLDLNEREFTDAMIKLSSTFTSEPVTEITL